jgi:hypothetical protein
MSSSVDKLLDRPEIKAKLIEQAVILNQFSMVHHENALIRANVWSDDAQMSSFRNQSS